MSNMSYCRFENTVADLDDCYESMSMGDNDLSDTEVKAKKRLIDMCIDIACDHGHENDRHVVEE